MRINNTRVYQEMENKASATKNAPDCVITSVMICCLFMPVCYVKKIITD